MVAFMKGKDIAMDAGLWGIFGIKVIEVFKGITYLFFTALLAAGMNYWREVYWVKPKLLKKDREKLAKALYHEIITIMEVYEKIRLDRKPDISSAPDEIPFSENVLAVYDNNVDKIGIFKDKDITAIMRFYLSLREIINYRKIITERWRYYVTFKRMEYSYAVADGNKWEKELKIRKEDVKIMYIKIIKSENALYKEYPYVKELLLAYFDDDSSKEQQGS